MYTLHCTYVGPTGGDSARQAFRAFQSWATSELEAAGRTKYGELSPGPYSPVRTLDERPLRYPHGLLWSRDGKIFAEGNFDLPSEAITCSPYWRQGHVAGVFSVSVGEGRASVAFRPKGLEQSAESVSL